MFTGVSTKQAIKYWLQGKEVVVLDRNSKTETSKYDVFGIEELFENLEFLVDLAAVPNPEFEETLKGTVADSPQNGKLEPSPAENFSGGGIEKPSKTKKVIIRELLDQGLTYKQIAEKTGFKYSTVSVYAGDLKKGMAAGHNEDRHLCKSCKFRSDKSLKRNGAGCAYIEATGHSRGCEVADCTVYEKGEPIKRKH